MTPTPGSPHAPSPQGSTQGLARLHKMSTTAGVALGEYSAVNALAVTSLVLGVASWMVWLHPLLYLAPMGAIALGLVAILQIRRSNGTQSGTGLAGLGILLAIALGGWALAGDLRQRKRTAADRTEISVMLEQFGSALAAGDYDAAYQFTSENFRREIDAETFRNGMAAESSRLGGIRGATSNQLARVMEDDAGNATAEAMLVVELPGPDPLRQQVSLVREEQGWRILEFEAWFPRQGRRR